MLGGRVVEEVFGGVEKAGVTPGFQRICVSLFPPVCPTPSSPAPSSNIPSIEKGIALGLTAHNLTPVPAPQIPRGRVCLPAEGADR